MIAVWNSTDSQQKYPGLLLSTYLSIITEKDGGCNHMICKNQACKSDFCWVCLGPWEPHGSSWYNCNRYDEDEARNARDGEFKKRKTCEIVVLALSSATI